MFAVGALAILVLIFNFRLEVFRPATGALEIPHYLWVASHVGIPGARPPPGQVPGEPAGAFGRSAVSISSLANGALGEQRELLGRLFVRVRFRAGLNDSNRI